LGAPCGNIECSKILACPKLRQIWPLLLPHANARSIWYPRMVCRCGWAPRARPGAPMAPALNTSIATGSAPRPGSPVPHRCSELNIPYTKLEPERRSLNLWQRAPKIDSRVDPMPMQRKTPPSRPLLLQSSQAVCGGYDTRMHAQRCGVWALLVPLLRVLWPMQGNTGIDFWCPLPQIQTTPLRLKLSIGYVELAASVRNGRSWPGGRASRYAGVQRRRHRGTWPSAWGPPAAANHPRIPYRPCVGVRRAPSLAWRLADCLNGQLCYSWLGPQASPSRTASMQRARYTLY
jgi:hypothetical protein